MNKFYATVIAFIFCLGAFFNGNAQTRSKLLNYQAVIIDPKPVFVPGVTQNSSTLYRKEVCLKFSFYDSIGMLEYEETQLTTTDDYGLVNLSIGNGNRIGGKHKSINEVVWDASLKTLEVGVSVDNCTNYTSISKQNLYFTPYALYAESVNYANVKNAPSKLSQFTNDKGFVQIQDLDLVKSDLLQALANVENNKSLEKNLGGLNSSDILYPTQKAVKAYVDATTASGSPDADAITKGKIKLTGDLGGTADIPTVPGLSLKVDKVDGKSLSTEDFTTAEKNKLGAISGVNTGDQDLSAYATISSLSSKENTVGAGTTTQYYRGDKSWQTLDKTAVGLTNVDNTTDADKPISTATQAVLDTKEAIANKSTDVTTDATSDEKYPSVKAIKTYVDAARTVSDIVTKTADYSVDLTNSTILCDATTAGFTLTLPDPTTVTGKTLVIIKIDESSNVLTITPGLHLTTVSTITSLNYPTSLKVQSNGTSWYIIK